MLIRRSLIAEPNAFDPRKKNITERRSSAAKVLRSFISGFEAVIIW
ncbi:hypothetical protein [Paenibacillus sp. HGF5]|nr:hypothetical protein [Paenibacillus sp. HGF5]EGG37627.1 hypothetical protein HMPREF9412_3373 [Paenibacillus sp. HGF5]